MTRFLYRIFHVGAVQSLFERRRREKSGYCYWTGGRTVERDIETAHFHYDAATRTLTAK